MKKFLQILLSGLFLSLACFLNAQTISTVFTTSGVFEVPAGVTEITVEAWGGGGGGGLNTMGAKGGGAGGDYARSTLTVTPGAMIPFTVGVGGGPGVAGTNSTWNGFTVIAEGGDAGAGTSGGDFGGGSFGDIFYNGGNGADASGNNGGGGGGSAFTGASGGNGMGTAGGIGTGNGGNGGVGNSNGTNGFAPGAGGGGKGGPDTGFSSGAGANGQIIVSYLNPSCATLTMAQGDVIQPQCFGGDDGFVSVVVTGGTWPYAFSWDDDPSTDSVRTGLSSGSYTVNILDDTGCEDALTFTLGQPSQLVISLEALTDETCSGAADGSIEVSATGGTGVISYLWSNSETGSLIENLMAGSYTVSATDGNGCSVSETFEVETEGINCCDISITSVTTTDEGCPGANEGTLTVTATCASCAGGNTDIRYSIDNIDFSNTTGVFIGLADGDYTVYVRDVNDIGCTDSDGPHTIAVGVDSEAPVPDVAESGGWAEAAKALASDGQAFDQFGWSVSINGDYVIVGAYLEDTGGSDAGAAYIFKRSGTSWVEEAKILASDAQSGDWFGYSVSISGDYAIVGAYREDTGGSDVGAAYIFKRSGTSWTEEAKIQASDAAANDWFGLSVSISGDYAIVGAVLEDTPDSNAGAAYIFKRSGTSWAEEAKILASDGQAFDQFGWSVSINGDYVIVGAYAEDTGGSEAGAAYIFKRSGTSWVEEAKIQASDAEAGDFFGYSVSISGDYAIAGSLFEGIGGIDAGAAYIFKRSGTSWVEEAKIQASDAAANDEFGYSVSISGDYAIVGAIREDTGGSNAGAAYIFNRSGTSWTEEAKIQASDAEAFDQFGWSVSINGDYAIVGAVLEDTPDSNAGAAYMFELQPGGLPAFTAECSATPPTPTATDNCAGTINGTTTAIFPITTQGTTTITWTYDDGFGNTTTQDQDIILEDLTNPVAICPSTAPTVVLDGSGNGTLAANALAGGNSTDNCAAAVTETSPMTSFSCADAPTATVVLTATDAAGNMNTTNCVVNIVDNEDPVISCPMNITLQATSQTGAVVTFADATATDNCSATVLQTAGAASGSTFAVGIHTITFEATDPSLNTVSCSFTIEVTPLYELSGTIRWEHDNAGVEAATVDLTGDATDNTLTNVDGEYDFEVAPGSYTLTPSKTDGLLNGVSVADVLAIQQHVTFVNPITDPYKLIAADVNQSSSISTLDALIVAQTILGNPVAEALFLNSWRFVDADYVFPNPASPWSFPSSISLVDVEEDTPAQDFVGVKMGDVNGSAMPNSNFWDDSWATRNNEMPVLVWQVDDLPLHTIGEELELTFNAGDLNELIAYQFGLGFSRSHLELLEVIPHEVLGLETNHFGTHLADAGELRGLWWEEQEGLSHSLAPGTPVFTLRFRVLRRAEHLKDHLWLDETILKDEAYRADRMRGRVVLEFAEQVVSATDAASSGQIKLYQNVPNPFDEVTRIGFELPEATEVKLRIMDVSGREIQLIEGRFAAGYNEVEVRNLPARGLFFYQLQTEGFTATLKMVRE